MTVGEALDIRVGDEAGTYGGTPRSSGISGKVVKVGRANVVLEAHVRFAPGGSVHVQQHKVGKHEITIVARDRTIIYLDDRLPAHRRGQVRLGDRIPEG